MENIMVNDGTYKQGPDFMADLLSGRIHIHLAQLTEQLGQTQQGINDMTQNEQKIIDAASVISEVTTKLRAGMDSLQSKITELQDQAGSDEAHDVEDLSQEFQTLNDSLGSLSQLADTMTPAPGGTPADVDVSISQPQPHDPNSTDPPPPGVTLGQPSPPETATDPDINPVDPGPDEQGPPLEDGGSIIPIGVNEAPAEVVPPVTSEVPANPPASEVEDDFS